jgi:putative ABC transport system substrate-binding protein
LLFVQKRYTAEECAQRSKKNKLTQSGVHVPNFGSTTHSREFDGHARRIRRQGTIPLGLCIRPADGLMECGIVQQKFGVVLLGGGCMRRRDFMLGAAAVAWPLSARAQQAGMPVVAILYAGSLAGRQQSTEAFRKGLQEVGLVEGQNVALDFHFADNNHDRLSEIASDLVRRRVAIIVIPGSAAAVRVVKAATTTIPIVFMNASDPVQNGLVASLSRPGGNVTGITDMGLELAAKRLGLLHELLPTAKRVAVLTYAGGPSRYAGSPSNVIADLQTAAAAIALELDLVSASTSDEINAAFAEVVQKRADALWVGPGSLFFDRREQITRLAAHYAIPAIYPLRAFTEVGGLMSYGSDITERSRQAGIGWTHPQGREAGQSAGSA